MSRTQAFKEALEAATRNDGGLRLMVSEYNRLLEYVQGHEGICAQEQPGDNSLTDVIIRYLESERNVEPLHCDYCDAVTDNPWHGSGKFAGRVRHHIHACDNCRHLLPVYNASEE